MRILLLIVFALFAGPALAQEGEHYDNARFGFGINIPPGFSIQGASDNADGQEYAAKGKAINLMVWGGNLTADFESETGDAMEYSEEAGWNVTFQAVTPRWASFSAIQGFRVLYQRMVLLCDSQSYAAFRAEYSVNEIAKMEPVIDKMERSLRGNGC